MSEGEHYSTCWTSSLLLKSVDPSVLSILQLQLLNILLQTVGASELTGSCAHLGLELKVNFTVSDDKHKDMIKEIVQDLASRISALLGITLNDDDGLPNLVCEVQAES